MNKGAHSCHPGKYLIENLFIFFRLCILSKFIGTPGAQRFKLQKYFNFEALDCKLTVEVSFKLSPILKHLTSDLSRNPLSEQKSKVTN